VRPKSRGPTISFFFTQQNTDAVSIGGKKLQCLRVLQMLHGGAEAAGADSLAQPIDRFANEINVEAALRLYLRVAASIARSGTSVAAITTFGHRGNVNVN
jgi:hypothetical protein